MLKREHLLDYNSYPYSIVRLCMLLLYMYPTVQWNLATLGTHRNKSGRINTIAQYLSGFLM